MDGGCAEKMLAPADFAAVAPDGVAPRATAPLNCTGVTTHKALKDTDVRPTQLVAISGVGGLGHLAGQYAKIAGATVAAIDVTDDKLELARELGTDILIDARKEDPAEVLKRHGGAHAAIALAVNE
ncbi:Alcohol dehydrogenase [Streptomyces formicae]|uniref:alcohol dehydrogenase n=1 Tax=Streptomyces formicae TaxID=1616117 RepID=A0A291QL88_9ACTN|nr:Alcohol dehydrogenase [Streptomyces formicae]